MGALGAPHKGEAKAQSVTDTGQLHPRRVIPSTLLLQMGHSLGKARAGPGSNGNYSLRFKENNATFPQSEEFPPALFNAFAFQKGVPIQGGEDRSQPSSQVGGQQSLLSLALGPHSQVSGFSPASSPPSDSRCGHNCGRNRRLTNNETLAFSVMVCAMGLIKSLLWGLFTPCLPHHSVPPEGPGGSVIVTGVSPMPSGAGTW